MKANEKDLQRFFGNFGKVRSVVMIRDKVSLTGSFRAAPSPRAPTKRWRDENTFPPDAQATNRHKGFAYVEMADLEIIPSVLLMNNQVSISLSFLKYGGGEESSPALSLEFDCCSLNEGLSVRWFVM